MVRNESLVIDNIVESVIKGAYDMHVHTSPDLLPRKLSDFELAELAMKYGLAGFVLKSHFAPTTERASLIRFFFKDSIKAFGSIVLNNTVGGLNPYAVEVAAKMGAKVVWMPTLDSLNEWDRWKDPRDPKAPYWVRIINEFSFRKRIGPVDIWKKDKYKIELKDEVYDILDIVKKYNMIIATGHLSPDSGFEFAKLASQYGVKKIIITHPELPSTLYTIEMQEKLIEYDVFFERCFVTVYTGKTSWDNIVKGIKVTGINNNILSTDLGQPENPDPPLGLAMFAQELIRRGFSTDEIRHMIVHNPRKLLEG